MQKIELVPCTAEHVQRFLPEPLPWRIRALTALAGDTIVGIGGLSVLPDGTMMAFLQVTEEDAKRYPVALLRAAKRTIQQAIDAGTRRIVAKVDDSREAAPRFLEHLGFVRCSDVDGETVYLWQR